MQRLSQGQASFTSSFVAMARAIYASAPAAYQGARDTHALALIPRRMAKTAAAMTQLWQLGAAGRLLLRGISFGLFEHVALRTSAIDAALDGCQRLVILGAGLDARAARLPIKEVIEVDHPATQAYKMRKAKEHRQTYVPIDFAHHKLSDVLPKSDKRTSWLMEGVSMYLPRAALSASIAEIAKLASQGDRFLLTYQPNEDNAVRAAAYGVVTSIVSAVGEPFIGRIQTSQLHAMLATHGFHVESDEDSHEWSARYYPSLLQLWIKERLVVSTRT